ncbi:MAG: hypothetical protein AVDCRST_MAG30-2728, partial [uncultured Solirubrobacteraceae bacterium]
DRLLQEGVGPAERHVARGGRRGDPGRVDRRPPAAHRRGVPPPALHPAQAGERVEQGQRRQGRGPDRRRGDAAGRPARLRGAHGEALRRLLLRAGGRAGARAGLRGRAAREPGRLGLLGGPAAGIPARGGVVGDQREAGGDPPAAPGDTRRGLRGRPAPQAPHPTM